MNPINLIPVKVRERAAVRRRMVTWGFIAAGYTLVLAAACGVIRLAGGDEQSRLETDGGRVSERITRAEGQVKDLRRQVQEIKQKVEASETVGVHPDWSILMRALTELRGDDIVLRTVEIKSKEPPPKPPEAARPADAATADASKPKPKPVRPEECYGLALRGFGLSQGGVLEFVSRLQSQPIISDVRLIESRAENFRGAQGVFFEVQCSMVAGVKETAAAEDTTP